MTVNKSKLPQKQKIQVKRKLICTLCPRDPITGGLTYDRNGDVIIDENCDIHGTGKPQPKSESETK